MSGKCYKDILKKFCFRKFNLDSFQLWNPSQHQWKMQQVLGGLKFQTCCVLTQYYLNHNVSLVPQAVFLQLTLKSECGLPFLMEMLEGLSLAHLIGAQTKPWAGNIPAMTRIIYLVSPASNFSWIPRVNHCLIRANQDVGICFFFHLILFGKVLPGWLRGCEHLRQMNLMLSYAFWEKQSLPTLAFCRSAEWGKEINVNLESKIDWKGCICK